MGGAKGIHHKDIAEVGVGFGKSVVVLFLARVKAHIFKDNHFTGSYLNAIGPALLKSNWLSKQTHSECWRPAPY